MMCVVLSGEAVAEEAAVGLLAEERAGVEVLRLPGLEVTARRLWWVRDAQGEPVEARLEGEVRVRVGEALLASRGARWSRSQGEVWLEGDVRCWRGQTRLEARRARVSVADQEIWLEKASGRVASAGPEEE
jgi:hypothetical protein